jgi:hypothetical protein
MLLFLLVLIQFWTLTVSQQLINVYPTHSVFFKLVSNQLFLLFPSTYEVWNYSNVTLLRRISNYNNSRIYGDGDTYIVVKAYEIERRFAFNDSLISLYYLPYRTQNGNNLFRFNSKYLYISSFSYYLDVDGNQIFTHEIRDKFTFEYLKTLYGPVPTSDDTGIYIPWKQPSGLYTFQKLDPLGNFLWNLTLEECFVSKSASFNPTTYAFHPFLFAACHNIVYQLDSVQGLVLQKIPTSGWQVTRITADDKHVFLLLVTGMVLQFRVEDARFIASYQFKSVLYDIPLIQAKDGYLFYSQSMGEPPPYYHGACSIGFSIIQWKIKTIEDPIIHIRNPTTSSKETPKLSVAHNKALSKSLINTATYVKRFNKIQRVLPQNSYFSPFMVRDYNQTWNFVYFSGAGNVNTGVCWDNFMHRIKITTFDIEDTIPSEPFQEINKKLFFLSNAQICSTLPSVAEMERASAIYDYASIFYQYEGSYMYLVHGGCPCYAGSVKSSSIYILFDENINFQYLILDQNMVLS